MLSPELFLAFLAALALLELSPGPDMMLVMARGIGQGKRTALCTVFGMVFVAGVVQVALLVFGLASVVSRYPLALQLLQWAGAAYLIYLGIKTCVSRTSPLQQRPTRAISDWQAVRQGAANSLTNPKSLLFMFAFLPQFVDPAYGPVWLQLLILGSIQKLTGILSLGAVAIAAGSAGQWLGRNQRILQWQEKFTGLVMVALGIRLFFSDSSAAAIASSK